MGAKLPSEDLKKGDENGTFYYMTDTTIHEIKVSYDDAHERVRNFIEHLKSEAMREEMKAYYDEAKNNENYKIHISDKYGNEFTMEYLGDYHCRLRLRDY